MTNPIAILFSPSRALALCFSLVVLYGLAVLGAIETSVDDEACDGSEIAAVELLN